MSFSHFLIELFVLLVLSCMAVVESLGRVQLLQPRGL